MCINFVGFIFLYFLQLFPPLFTSFTTFLSVIYVLFRFLYLFLFTCPLHWLFFCPFSFNGFLISKLFFPLVTFSFFHTKFSFVYFIVLLHFFPFCTLFIISVSFHFFLPGTFHFSFYLPSPFFILSSLFHCKFLQPSAFFQPFIILSFVAFVFHAFLLANHSMGATTVAFRNRMNLFA